MRYPQASHTIDLHTTRGPTPARTFALPGICAPAKPLPCWESV
jgi:hypothetical protein